MTNGFRALAAAAARSGTAVALAAGTLSIAGLAPVQAQGRLDARYGVSLAGISIAKAEWTVEIDGGRYVAAANGSASGLLSVLFDGEGQARARGTVEYGRPVPGLFVSRSVGDSARTQTTMRIENGNVADLQIAAEATPPDIVPLTPADRHGVIDPLTAFLVPIAGAFDVLSAEICQRALPIFDGQRRYDLRLSFKRMEQVKAFAGYSGPAIVCAATFRAYAGHRAGSALVRYLSDGRDMELWLAPLTGTRVVVPLRASVAGVLGNLVVQATHFEMRSLATTSARNVGNGR